VTQSGLLTALRVLETSAGAFPPLKSAVGGLVACLDLAQVSHGCVFNTLCFYITSQVVAGNLDDYEKLAADLTIMAKSLAPYVTRLVTDDVSGSVARIME